MLSHFAELFTPDAIFGCDGFQHPVVELPVENGKQDFMVFRGALFLDLPDGIPDNNGWRNGLSWWTSFRHGVGVSLQITGSMLLFQCYTNTRSLVSGGHGKDNGIEINRVQLCNSGSAVSPTGLFRSLCQL